ncbi:MAG: energy transducer TonB [Fusobacteriaceae bacterium]
MKFILISFSIHLFIFFYFFSENNPDLKIKKDLKSTIQINLAKLDLKKEIPNTGDNLENNSLEIKEKKIDKESETKKIEKPMTKTVKKVAKKVAKKVEKPSKKSTVQDLNLKKNDLNSETLSDNESISSSLNSENDSEFSFQGKDKIAKNQNISGLNYSILKEVAPNYPIQAKKMGYKKQVTIKTKFLVNYEGKVENIEILEGLETFGFREEVLKALKNFRFTPVFYKDEKIKLYFYKDFIFTING